METRHPLTGPMLGSMPSMLGMSTKSKTPAGWLKFLPFEVKRIIDGPANVEGVTHAAFPSEIC